LIVVDASVAVQWVAEEVTSAEADTLLPRSDLIAPDFMLIEVANALYRKVFVGEVSEAHATAGLEFIRDRVDQQPVTIDLLSRAISMANEMNHAVYDCLYLAIAELKAGRLVTYDQELRGHAKHHGYGHLIADLPLQD
jgi:predicted nucleic acid-binding protein